MNDSEKVALIKALVEELLLQAQLQISDTDFKHEINLLCNCNFRFLLRSSLVASCTLVSASSSGKNVI